MKIYIGCALTHAPKEFRDMVGRVKDTMRARGFEILDFIGLEKGTEKDVYIHDLACVDTCDAFVALCDYPAIGLGVEIERALEISKKPTLLLAHQDTHITRLLVGASQVHHMCTLQRYAHREEISDMVEAWLTSIPRVTR